MDSKQVVQQQDRRVASGDTGIYTLTSGDLETVAEIERMKLLYIQEIESMSKRQAMNQLSSLLSNMQIFMEKYGFYQYLQEEVVEGEFTFSYIKKIVPLTDGDNEFLLKACEIAFVVWESVLKQLGFGVPTSSFRSSPQVDN